MRRPALRPIPLADVLPLGSRPVAVITLAVGQWDSTLAASYEGGFVLLELDDEQQPLAAYKKAGEAEVSS